MSTQTKTQLEDEIAALKAQIAAQNGLGLMVKVNASGGAYIRHQSFKAWSDKKDKEYTAGINMNMRVAKALFSNLDLCKEIAEKLAKL